MSTMDCYRLYDCQQALLSDEVLIELKLLYEKSFAQNLLEQIEKRKLEILDYYGVKDGDLG